MSSSLKIDPQVIPFTPTHPPEVEDKARVLFKNRIRKLSELEAKKLYEQIEVHREKFVQEAKKSPNGTIYRNSIGQERFIRPIVVTDEGKIFVICKKHKKGKPEDPRAAIDPLIGKGGFKMVWTAYDAHTGEKYAAARPKYSRGEAGKLNSDFKKDYSWMLRINPELALCFVEYKDKALSIQEKFDMPFSKSMRSVSLEFKLEWFIKLADQLKLLHICNFVHNDLKEGNFLYCYKELETKLAIIDFGLCRSAKDFDSNVYCGTKEYYSPEKFKCYPKEEVGLPSDIWSFGIALMNITFSTDEAIVYPFQRVYDYLRDPSDPEPHAKIKEFFNQWKDKWLDRALVQFFDPPPCLDHIPQSLSDLIHDMLRVDPNSRPTIHEVKERLIKIRESFTF